MGSKSKREAKTERKLHGLTHQLASWVTLTAVLWTSMLPIQLEQRAFAQAAGGAQPQRLPPAQSQPSRSGRPSQLPPSAQQPSVPVLPPAQASSELPPDLNQVYQPSFSDRMRSREWSIRLQREDEARRELDHLRRKGELPAARGPRTLRGAAEPPIPLRPTAKPPARQFTDADLRVPEIPISPESGGTFFERNSPLGANLAPRPEDNTNTLRNDPLDPRKAFADRLRLIERATDARERLQRAAQVAAAARANDALLDKPVLSRPVEIATLKDGEGNPVKIVYEGATRRQLEAFKLSNLRASRMAGLDGPSDKFFPPYRPDLTTREGMDQAMRSIPQKLQRLKSGAASMGRELIHEIPSEWLGWVIALGAAAALINDSDPAFWRTFAEENLSPVMIPVFLAFIAGMRMSEGMLKWAGAIYDPMHAPKSYFNTMVASQNNTLFLRPGMVQVNEAIGPNGEVVATSTRTIDRVEPFKAPSVVLPDQALGGRPVGRVSIVETTRPIPFIAPNGHVNREVIWDTTESVQMRPHPARHLQKVIEPVRGPIGMTLGMFLSLPVSDFFTDPNIWTCVNFLTNRKIDYYGKPMTPDQGQAACDANYEEWVLTKKLDQWAPNVIAMAVFGGIYAGSTVAGAAAARYLGSKLSQPVLKNLESQGLFLKESGTDGMGKRYVFEKVATDPKTGQAFRQTRIGRIQHQIALKILSTQQIAAKVSRTLIGHFTHITIHGAVFELGLYLITPPIERWWRGMMDGRAIVKRLTDLKREVERMKANRWKWSPREFQTRKRSQTTAMALDLTQFDPSIAQSFKENQLSPGEHLNALGDQLREWRRFLMQPAMTAYDKWDKYTQEFVVTYANAWGYYTAFLEEVRRTRHDNLGPCDISVIAEKLKANPNAPVPRLNCEDPFHGYKRDPAEIQAKTGFPSLPTVAAGEALAFVQSRLAQSSLKHLTTTEQTVLPRLAQLLSAGDPSTDLRTAFPNEARPLLARSQGSQGPQGSKVVSGGPSDHSRILEQNLRIGLLNQAVTIIRRVLLSDPHYSIAERSAGGVQKLSRQALNQLAEQNPFVKILTLLGDPDPMPPGLSFHNFLATSAQTINQDPEKLQLFPSFVGNVSINNYADFMLASMVCGPDVDRLPPREQRVARAKEYLNRKVENAKALARAIKELKWDQAEPSPDDPEVIRLLREELSERLAPNKTTDGWLPSFNRDQKLVLIQPALKSVFNPPRIVSDRVPRSICTERPASAPDRDSLQFDMHRNTFIIDGKPYRGFIEVVYHFARPDIIGNMATPPANDVAATNAFIANQPLQKWWEANIDPTVTRILHDLRARYQRVIETEMVPTLVRADPDSEVVRNGHAFYKGVFTSMRQQLELKLDMIESTLFQSVGLRPEAQGRSPSPQMNLRAQEAKIRSAKEQFEMHKLLLMERFKTLELAVSNSEAVKNDRSAAWSTFNDAKDDYGQAVFALELFMKEWESQLEDAPHLFTDPKHAFGPDIEADQQGGPKTSGIRRNRRARTMPQPEDEALERATNSINGAALKHIKDIGVEMLEYWGFISLLRNDRM